LKSTSNNGILAKDHPMLKQSVIVQLGTVYPELVSVSSEQTPVETGASASPVVAVSPVVEVREPRLKSYLSRGERCANTDGEIRFFKVTSSKLQT
jgi:hypothetical protein